MHVKVNLASEPFRHDRATVVTSSIIGLVLLGLLGVLSILIMTERGRLKESRAAVADLNAQLRAVDLEQAKLDGTLRIPANAEVVERSILWNALVERKAISWAKIFSDLETVLPNDVRLIQIRLPQITSHNEVVLDMEVGAKDPIQVIEFLKRLEASPLFGPPTQDRSNPPTQNEPLYRYRILVNYAQKL